MLPTQMSGANQFTPLGKIVESVDIVKATDIPMDGNMYYFPTALYNKYRHKFINNPPRNRAKKDSTCEMWVLVLYLLFLVKNLF